MRSLQMCRSSRPSGRWLLAVAMDLSLGLVVYGVILLEGVATHVRRNPQLVRNISLAIKKQLGSVRPRGLGAKVELETLLADVTYANGLARPFPVEGGRRYHFEVGWRGNARAFLAVARLSMKLARLFGDVVIDVQYAGGSPGVDGFEWVLPLKTCSISTFYGHVLPLLQQVATDAEHVGAGDDAAGDGAGAGEGRGSGARKRRRKTAVYAWSRAATSSPRAGTNSANPAISAGSRFRARAPSAGRTSEARRPGRCSRRARTRPARARPPRPPFTSALRI